MPFLLQGVTRREGTRRRRLMWARFALLLRAPSIAPGLRFRVLGTALRRRQLHSRAPGFGEPNRNRLFRAPRAVLSLPHVLDLFANEFASLCGRRLSFARVPARPLDSLLFRHRDLRYSFSNHLSFSVACVDKRGWTINCSRTTH